MQGQFSIANGIKTSTASYEKLGCLKSNLGLNLDLKKKKKVTQWLGLSLLNFQTSLGKHEKHQ